MTHDEPVGVAHLFDEHAQEKAISPSLKDKVQKAFLALEDVLKEAFPNSKNLNRILFFIELAASIALSAL